MAFATVAITEQQVARLLALTEGHFSDLKSCRITPAKLTRSISAFANADGGELFVGIDENTATETRAWGGFPDPEAANGHVQIFEQLFPLGQEFSYEFFNCADRDGVLLHITIQKTREIKRARGAQNLPVDTEEALTRLRLNKGLTSFENDTVDVNTVEVTNSIVIINFLLEVIPTAEPLNWLRKQQLIRADKPTVASVLLFADEPAAILPKRCGIKVYQYKTKDLPTRDTLAFDPLTVEGPIYDQIRDAVDLTVKAVESISVLGVGGLEHVAYPVEAVHEIITNGVLHRDYSIADDVHVRVFENRIEIESPGRLPGHVTVHNILDERFARNGNLVRLINKFPNPPNKDVGEGLNTAFEAMRKLRLKDPVVQQLENSVLVTIRHESLASSEELVMAYLETHDEINNSKAREICHIGSENVMKRTFERLMKRELIERVPGRKGKATAYRKRDAQAEQRNLLPK
jgi:ATP-dependent DNA helicase RecG